MSDPPRRTAKTPEFDALWTDVLKLVHKSQEKKHDRQMPRTATSLRAGLQSPKQQGCSRNHGSRHAESPGDVEVSQDIVWDSTSPTQAITGHRSTRVVAISDIVNRIVPKDVRPERSDSSLLRWIGDGAIPSTPDTPRQRVRKKANRQSSVDDLLKLARQFDKNMQQDADTSGDVNPVNTDLVEGGRTSESKPPQPPFPDHAKHQKCPSSAEQAEAELHALFDSSTQAISGRLSGCSSTSAPSQEIKQRSVASTNRQESALKSGEKGCGSHANDCDGFEDDWENDDFLNDSVVLAMTQNPTEQQDTKATLRPHTQTSTAQFNALCKLSTALPSPNIKLKPTGRSALQELCPKPKTLTRSTFKLQPNPAFQAKEASKSSFTAELPKMDMSHQKPAATSSASRTSHEHSGAPPGAGSAKDISDSLWDDGDDDALLYQVCDNMERISSSQQTTSADCIAKQDLAAHRAKQSTGPLPIATACPAGVGVHRQSPRAFVLSNSLPGPSREATNYQGWNIPMKGSGNRSHISQSFPGSSTDLGTLSQLKDSSGNFHAGNASVALKPQKVTPGALHGSKSHQTAFKRNVSDSAAICSKVFVTSQTKGKCTAAEIERKKQEALARRRLRMQSASHHKAAP